ncbi:serine hydroxymethyltransferase 7-like [Pyrus ussuriensis x Pyrus communis]|uniref:Serine hydroxymethyltransferase 7-like n=1 Tax=Pyrus ussuriensis x Pyrus communis TaxID=2448454 RepID=A0A5N5GDR0_9ROSA|nr:serine hydroxymethyltransferase 7-like [Pyrus ussuriensis x Pyrus communis]
METSASSLATQYWLVEFNPIRSVAIARPERRKIKVENGDDRIKDEKLNLIKALNLPKKAAGLVRSEHPSKRLAVEVGGEAGRDSVNKGENERERELK